MSLRTLVPTAIFVITLPALGAAPPPPPPPPAPPVGGAPGAPAADAPKGDPSKTDGRFKNIQVLKGYPADDLLPAMNFMSASLGVDCDFCHVDRAPEKDDKDAKKIARKMITMTMAINKEHFDGHREITCMSCHRGSTEPVAVPLIAADRREDEEPAAKPELPAATAILDKYVQALGGAAALGKVNSRTQKGNLSGFGPAPMPVEVATKGKDKRKTTIQTPRGENITAVNGATGWLAGGGRPPREMSPTESDAARLDAAILSGTDPRSLFQEFKVVGPDKIEGKDTIKVIGRNPGKPGTQLWFDTQSGLLLRMIKFAETPLGRNPTQLDIADYRDAGGVKNPYRWTVARPGSSFTIQIETAQQNAPIEDTVFVKPQ